MTCNSSDHSPSCPEYRNNSLKGASAIPKTYSFNLNDISILEGVLKIGRFFVKDQNKTDLLKDIDSAINILSARKNNQKIYLLKK